MAQPISPFSGLGGYGSIMSPYYQQVSQQVGDEFIARENAKIDSLQQALNSAMGLGIQSKGGDAGLIQKAIPSSLNEYYAQASELDKKSSAAKKMLEVNPKLFGLSEDEAKGLSKFTDTMSSTERYDFFQQYVPTLFKAQQAKLEQDAAMGKALAGREPVPDLSGMGEGLRAVTGTQSAPSNRIAPRPTPSGSSEMEPKPLQVPPDPLLDEDTLRAADYYMRKTYDEKWREKGIKITNQDLRNAGIIP